MFQFQLDLIIFFVSLHYTFGVQHCAKDYLYCGENDPVKCVPSDWWCDGHADCDFGKDEVNCFTYVCHETEISCKSGVQCIPKLLKCDGTAQCLDGSDEDNCDISKHHFCDSLTQFDCNGDGYHCINLSKVCDGQNDCGRNQDEQPGGSLDNCQRNDCKLTENGGCTHFCTNIFTKRLCHCPVGHKLLEDTKTCVDIDECSFYPSRCTQSCKNMVGSYQCSCHEGYVLNPNILGECIAEDGDRSVLATLDNGEILSFDIGSNINIVHNISTSSHSWTHIDAHIGKHSETTIYWSSLKDKSIGKTVIKRKFGSSDIFKVISQSQIFNLYNDSYCAGLSFDWLRSLLFWTSIEVANIYVTNTTSNKTSILLTKGLDNPRAIVVDPFETKLYWIDLGNKVTGPRIDTMLMNTQDHRVLVKTGLRQPMGITIDFVDYRLYWSDINPGSIMFIDLSKPLRKETVVSNKLLHPFSVFVFENKVYWSDWRQNQIISVDKTTGNHLNVMSRVFKPMSIQILNKVCKPPLSSKTLKLHSCLNILPHSCSDICLPPPPTTNLNYISIKCSCGIGSLLSNDNYSCIFGSNSLILPKNVKRFSIILAVIISLAFIILLFTVIMMFYLCRERLCTKTFKNMSRHGTKHPIITGDLMYIFKCHSHSSQLSELLASDFSSLSNA